MFSIIWSYSKWLQNSPIISDGRHKQNSRNDWMLYPSKRTCDSSRKAVRWLHFFLSFATLAETWRSMMLLTGLKKHGYLFFSNRPQRLEQRTTNGAHVGQAAVRYAHFHCTHTGTRTYHMHARLGL